MMIPKFYQIKTAFSNQLKYYKGKGKGKINHINNSLRTTELVMLYTNKLGRSVDIMPFFIVFSYLAVRNSCNKA